HRAHFHAGLVLDVDAGLHDHIGHLGPPRYVRAPMRVFPFLVRLAICIAWSRRCQATRREYHCVFRRGSSASRSESPNRLKANTERLMASPGKIAIHGAVSANSTAAPRSISPQAAVGSCTPSPRNDNDDSARIACPRNAVSMMR